MGIEYNFQLHFIRCVETVASFTFAWDGRFVWFSVYLISFFAIFDDILDFYNLLKIRRLIVVID